MEYIDFTKEEQLDEIDKKSIDLANGVLIFKHSTTCSISKMALSRFSRSWNIDKATLPIYFLDLLQYRAVSNAVATKYGVQHESPQVLLIKNGQCVYHNSHMGISPGELTQMIDG